jgi:hypothetical protein
MNKNLRKFSIIFFFISLWFALSNITYIILAQEMENYKGDLTYYDFIDEKGIDWQLKFEPQNNIDKIVSSVIYIDLVSVPATAEDILMELTVNNELHCSPEIFKLDGFEGSKKIKFDCFGIINRQGIYNLHLSTTQTIKGISGSYEIIYYTTPSWQKTIESIEKKINETSWQKSIENIEKRLENKITMGTGGTEYGMNEPARIFARLLDGNSRPIDIASCNVTIYYPNNTKLLNNVPLTLLEKGIYYYDFTTPNITGNYITVFDCIFPSIPFIQNISINVPLASLERYNGAFLFDNSNNITINSAYMTWVADLSATGVIFQTQFNYQVINQTTGIKALILFNKTLTQSDFLTISEQVFQFQNLGSGTATVYYARLYVNYTWNDPQQIIRGQDEVHIGSGNVSYVDSVGNVSYVDTVGNASATFRDLRYAGGTEYLSNTEGQIAYQFLETSQGNPSPVNNANCNMTIWFPNNSVFISNQAMPYLSGSSGIYVTNFSVPSTQGVYKTNAICYSSPKWSYGASTFHVENTLYNNQQTIYSFLQTMNTTMVSGHNYISSLVQNVSTQITDSWTTFWNSVSARITS